MKGLSTGISSQTTLDGHFSHAQVPDFGNFGDADKYAGDVPSESYLSAMLNKAIEHDEALANQHTAMLNLKQMAMDDSYKVSVVFKIYQTVNSFRF